jgi:hypothetical protein
VSAAPGTFLSFPWFQLLPGGGVGWYAERLPAGMVDDGREPADEPPLHEPRLPGHPSGTLEADEIVVLHYQAAEPERWGSKQRWYQCLERIEYPSKRAAEIYRQYHERGPAVRDDLVPTPASFFDAYEERGIDMRGVAADGHYRWDADVIAMLLDRGPRFFRKLDIWDVNWTAIAHSHRIPLTTEIVDPRSSLDRAVLHWLRYAQPRRRSPFVRAASRALRVVGW